VFEPIRSSQVLTNFLISYVISLITPQQLERSGSIRMNWSC